MYSFRSAISVLTLASVMATTQANALEIPYALTVNGSSTGATTTTLSGSGTLVVTIDENDLSKPGAFTINTLSAMNSSFAFGELNAVITTVITGVFDASTFLNDGNLVITATSTVTDCTYDGIVFGSTLCSTPSLGGFQLISPFEPVNIAIGPNYDLISFDVMDVTESPIGYVYMTTTYSSVPVPASAWLFGSALLGLAGIKRKK